MFGILLKLEPQPRHMNIDHARIGMPFWDVPQIVSMIFSLGTGCPA